MERGTRPTEPRVTADHSLKMLQPTQTHNNFIIASGTDEQTILRRKVTVGDRPEPTEFPAANFVVDDASKFTLRSGVYGRV